MKKRFVLLIVILFLFTLPIGSLVNLFGPNIDSPVFVKSLIYAEDMDIDLNYIAPRGFEKSIEKIEILDAPKGVDCVVYEEEKEFGIKYTIGTVNMGVNYAHWNEKKGKTNDLEIKEILVTWSDNSQTTEEIGSITVIGKNIQCNNYMSTTMHEGIRKATYTLTNDTEVIGLDFPCQDEVFNLVSNITINNVDLENISIKNPVTIKKNERCTIKFQIDDENETSYGNVSIIGFLMGKSSENKEKIACFTFDKPFGFDESAGEYLKKVPKKMFNTSCDQSYN